MDQQEFMPDSQKQHAASQDNEETYTKSYSEYRTSDMPKRDNPSDYSGTIPPYSYRAQNPAGSGQQQTQSQQTSNAKQGTQYNPRQQANTQRQDFSDTFEKLKKTFTSQNNNNTSQNQPWNWQQSVPPYMRPQQQTKTGPNWLVIILIVCFFLFIVPIMLRLLLVMFIAMFSIGIGMLILIGCAILIYKFYFKTR